MFNLLDFNMSVSDVLKKVLRYKEYFGDNGGVAISGGEPLLQLDFVINLCKALHNEGINVTLDTAGAINNITIDILNNFDLIMLDIKGVDEEGYFDITNHSMNDFNNFLEVLKKTNVDIWIRQVIVPGVNDTYEYIDKLKLYLKDIPNIKKIELLPFHQMGSSKYETLGLNYPYKDKETLDNDKLNLLIKYLEEKE